MKITEVSRELIEGKIAEARESADNAGATRKELDEQIAVLQKRAYEQSEARSAAIAKIEILMGASVLNKGVPADIASLRSEVFAKTAQSQRDDITVGEQKRLKAEIPELEAELQKQCAHPFVVQTRSPYSGSHSYDHDDSHFGKRVCAVCGFSENSWSCDEDKYKTLTANTSERVVVWAPLIEKTPLVKWLQNGWFVDARLPIEEIIDCLTDKRAIRFLS